MKAAVDYDLLNRVVQQNTVPRKTAAHDDLISVCGGIEQVSDFREQVLKVTVHRQDIITSRYAVAISDSAADAIGWQTKQRFDPAVLLREAADRLRCIVLAVIVDENDLVDVLIE